MTKLLCFFALSTFLFTACEEQMIMIPEAPIVAEGRVMLIEDMTGANCPPCHSAIAILEANLEANKNSIVAYGVHGKIQSEPVDGSKYDFRYPAAEALEASYNIIGKPAATFNRTTFPNGSKTKLNSATWQTEIDAQLQKDQVMDIQLLSTYDPESRSTDIEVAVTAIEGVAGPLNLHLMISESHLIDSQKSPVEVIKDFEHNHVLKESLTGLQGDPISSSGAIVGEVLKKRYTYTIPAESNGEWIPENMEITAFVTAANREDEVQQAAQIHLTE